MMINGNVIVYGENMDINQQLEILNRMKASGRRLLLIVDDQEINRDILYGFLEDHYEIMTASDGEEALRTVHDFSDKISMILLDLNLPRIDGTEVLTRIKADKRSKDIPVIITTAREDVEEKMLGYGASDFISKPYHNPGVIRARVENMIRMSEAIQAINAGIYDKVTGLYAMRPFLDIMAETKEQVVKAGNHEDYALVYINLTNFKLYNGKYGLEAGDDRLREVAAVIRSVFKNCVASRLSADHFAVLTSRADQLEGQLKQIQEKVKQIGNTSSLNIKAGIKYFSKEDVDLSPAAACDQAKIASDSIKNSAEKTIAVFDKFLSDRLRLKSYIINNIDQAIANGYIKVYYQPVIRSFNGKLCGMEALTRWIDPENGFMNPGIFIPILEEAYLIHKLDAYVIDQVGKMLREQIDQGLPVVPVSFNFSRIDFITGHPYDTVEETVEKYSLRRSLMRCEITESTLMADKSIVQKEIEKFHQNGYEVWMDDFGSGYSTLNILQEFHFDEIKIDMQFLRNLNDEGKKIITTIVSMAKKLGTHTLTEGCETQEQADFLKQIGCEKIQGYFYGKPMPYDELTQHCRDFGISFEDAGDGQLFDKAGIEDINTNVPTAIIMDDGEVFTPLVVNNEYINSLKSAGTNTIQEMIDNIVMPEFSMTDKLRVFADKVIKSRQEETVSFVDNGQYLRLRAKLLSSVNGKHVYRAVLTNITFDSDVRQSEFMDSMLRNIVLLYKNIYYWNVSEDTLRVIETSNPWEKEGDVNGDALAGFYKFNQKYVYPDDRDRFRIFIDPERIYMAAGEDQAGFVGEVFRIKQADGNYKWIEIIFQILYRTENKDILILFKETKLDDKEFGMTFLQRYSPSEDLSCKLADGQKWSLDSNMWRNLMQNSSIRFFWKDKKRRFVGVSKSFLEAYGIEDADEIIGKTDDEVGWHIDGEIYRNDELDVLQRGMIVRDSVGQCIIQGVTHTISATKFPIYEDGEIIGLIGYFFDTEVVMGTDDQWKDEHYIDAVTGLLSVRGTSDAVMQYEEMYHRTGKDYLGVMLEIPEYDWIEHTYGKETSDELLRIVADKIREYAPMETVAARITQGRFMIVCYPNDIMTARNAVANVLQDIHNIKEINGVSCTLYMKHTYLWRSEVNSAEALTMALTERLANNTNENVVKGLFAGDLIAFDRRKLDSMSDRIYIADPDTYDLIYVNHTALDDLKLPHNYDVRGKKCYEFISGRSTPCEHCSNPRLTNDKFCFWNYHNTKVGNDYLMKDTLIPFKDKQYRFTMATNLTEYSATMMENQEFVYKEMKVNDAIGIAMQEDDIEEGINKLLEKLCQDNKADRAYIFEYEPGRYASNTYEYCRDEVEPEIDELQHLSPEQAAGFYEFFDRNEHLVINDIEELINTHPRTYETLKPQNIHSLVSVEIRDNNKRIGFLGIDNPEPANIAATGMMLKTLAQFVAFMIRDRDSYRKLSLLGTRDALTGVMNRGAFAENMKQMADGTHYAFIYGDVNGLKELNDRLGHEAGDKLIRATADVCSSVVGSENVYRMGGDEFLLVTEVEDQEQADMLLKELRTRFNEEEISVALGCVWKTSATTDIDELLKEADRRMYANKKYMKENIT